MPTTPDTEKHLTADDTIREKLIHSHVHHCIENARDQVPARKKLRDLLTVLERYVE